MIRLLKTLPLVILFVTLLSAAASAQDLVTVTFANRTNFPAKVFWLNDGEKRHYLDLEPGESRQLQTYVGHRWTMSGPQASMRRTVVRENEVFTLGRTSPRPTPTPAPAPAPAPQPETPRNNGSVNRQVLDYAQSVVGQWVGNGQCTELAIEALRVAGARPNQGYVWGTPVTFEQLQPGDIVQFHSPTFVLADGYELKSPGPHTMVVESVEGTKIHVLHQNVVGSAVQTGTYDPTQLIAGVIEYYRPIPASSNTGSVGRSGYGRSLRAE